jgi:catechol 2,3-dioxygenase-like lactoylglutathione lyase family enzyme
MPVTFGSLVLKVSNIGRAAEFWSKALGYVPVDGRQDYLGPASGEGPEIHLDEDDRTHLDLWVDREASDVEAEVARLISLGARRVNWRYPEGAEFVVLADTEGNLFCVIA